MKYVLIGNSAAAVACVEESGKETRRGYHHGDQRAFTTPIPGR